MNIGSSTMPLCGYFVGRALRRLLRACGIAGSILLLGSCERRAASTLELAQAAMGTQAVVALVQDGVVKCTGVLIAPESVLTVHHCVKRHPRLGVALASSISESVQVSSIAKHPSLDVALLRLAAPIGSEVPPLPLRSESAAPLLPNQGVQVAGAHAMQGAAFALTAVLAEVNDELVVRYDGTEGLCLGDSGGPLLVADAGGGLVVAGLLRGGARHCRGPDRFVRADRISPWLQTQLAAL